MYYTFPADVDPVAIRARNPGCLMFGDPPPEAILGILRRIQGVKELAFFREAPLRLCDVHIREAGWCLSGQPLPGLPLALELRARFPCYYHYVPWLKAAGISPSDGKYIYKTDEAVIWTLQAVPVDDASHYIPPREWSGDETSVVNFLVSYVRDNYCEADDMVYDEMSESD